MTGLAGSGTHRHGCVGRIGDVYDFLPRRRPVGHRRRPGLSQAPATRFEIDHPETARRTVHPRAIKQRTDVLRIHPALTGFSSGSLGPQARYPQPDINRDYQRGGPTRPVQPRRTNTRQIIVCRIRPILAPGSDLR